jgi:outer membrane receptor protein involved in Fe transport
MLRVKILIIAVVINTIFSKVNGQSCSVTGKIVEQESRQPVSYANVGLYDASDSILVTGGLTNEKGLFFIEKIKKGKYYLEVSFIGYQPVIYKSFMLQPGLRDIGTIELQLSFQNIEEVTIKSVKAPVTYKVDRKVIDAGSFPGAEFAMDLLENIPSLQVNFEGKLTYRGDGTFKVYINDRPVFQGEEKLRQLPAGKIDKIEVITNPSVSYSSEGTAGIINVVLKRNSLEGYAIGANFTVNTLQGTSGSFTVDKKAKSNGWYIEAYLSNSIWDSWEANKFFKIEYPDKVYETTINGKGKYGGVGSYIEFGLNYDITPKDYIDFSIIINPLKTTNFNYSDEKIIESVFRDGILNNNIIYTLESNKNLFYRYIGPTFSYEHRFDKHRTHLLSAYFIFSSYLHDMKEKQIDSKIYETKTERIGFVGTEKNELLFNAKINYAIPLGNKIVVENGIEIDIDHIPEVTSTNGNFSENEIITPFAGEPLNQKVDFAQDIISGYSFFKSEFDKFSLQVGLRAEKTFRRSNYYKTVNARELITPSENIFIDFFPSAHLSYNFSENHQTSVSYSRRIERPDYWALIPLKQYNSPYSFYTGNGNLLPAYTNAYELSYLKSWDKDFIGFDIFHRTTNNVLQTYLNADSANYFISTTENVGQSISTGFEMKTGINIFSWWYSNFSFSLYSYQLNVKIRGIDKTENLFRTSSRLNNKILLPRLYTFNWDVLYDSPMITAQTKREGYLYANIAIKKDLKNDKWSVSLLYNNFFNSIKYNTVSKAEKLYISDFFKKKPFITFKIAYKFDNQK